MDTINDMEQTYKETSPEQAIQQIKIPNKLALSLIGTVFEKTIT